MGTMMRPVLCDFSSGEIDPRLAGRVDLDLAMHGATHMKNFRPGRLGGAYKRGGMKFIMDLGEDSYMIPWSVGEGYSFLVILQDHKMKLAYFPGDSDPYLLLGGDGNSIEIPHLDGVGGSVPAYAIADAPNVKYAQCLNELSLVCRGYPSFTIRFNGLSADKTQADFTYGIDSFTGNIASNPEISADDYTKKVTAATFIDTFHGLAPDTDFTTTAESYIMVGTVKKTVTKIRISGGTVQRHAYDSLAKTTIYDGSGTVGHHYSLATKAPYGKFVYMALLFWEWHDVIDPVDTILSGGTQTSLLEKLAAMAGDGGTVYFADADNHDIYCGYYKFYAFRDTRSVTVTFADASTLAVNYASAGLEVNLELVSPSREISGGVIDSSVILDYTVPWMTPGKTYPCSDDSVLEGVKVVSAVRVDTTSEPQLKVFRDGESEPFIITRDTLGKTGKIGVIVTPFYAPGDYPTFVAYHQNRKVLGGSAPEPNVAYLSKVNDFSNFAFFEEIEFTETTLKDSEAWTDPLVPETRTETSFVQQIQASSAIKLVFATEKNESVKNACSYGDLYIGTGTSDWVIPAAVNATNVQALLADRTGSDDSQARFVKGGVAFISRDRRSVRLFSAQAGTIDLMQAAGHIAKAGICDMDIRQVPDQEIWAVLDDGTTVAMTKAGEGSAWWQVATKAGHLIKSVAVLPGDTEDALFFIVKRGSAYNLERLVTPDDTVFPSASVAGRAHLDAYTVVASASGISGLTRFASQSASIHIGTVPELRGTVTFSASGNATVYLPEGGEAGIDEVAIPNGLCLIGYAFDADLETCRLDSSATEGMLKTGSKVQFRVYESGSFDLYHGMAMGTSELVNVAIPLDSTGGVAYPYSGLLAVENPAGEATDQTIRVKSSDGQPVNILVVAPGYEAGGIA